jgi:hypothetical protein
MTYGYLAKVRELLCRTAVLFVHVLTEEAGRSYGLLVRTTSNDSWAAGIVISTLSQWPSRR